MPPHTVPRPEGAALLIAGYAPGGPEQGSAALHALGQIGATLLATSGSWHVRRLSMAAGERHLPERATIKRFVDELVQRSVGAAVIAISGRVARVAGGPALVTGAAYRDYPDDATLPLAWLGERLRAARAERLLLVLSADTDTDDDGDAREWLAALANDRPGQVIAVGSGALLDAALGGLRGGALDPAAGAVTMRSISEHLARSVPHAAIQASRIGETLAGVPPLHTLSDPRLSRRLQATLPQGPPEMPRDLTGLVLPGRFRIERELAHGSFGTVYRARQLSIERDVAVKVLHADLDPASEDGRLFVHEIQSVGRIDHENVVRIFQADVTPHGRLFYAMELLVGADLQQVVEREGTLERDRAVALTQQLLAGLGAVHDAGLVHADVKPANILLSPARTGERLVLLDFGLARLKPIAGPASSAGGTPAYMAPEHLHNERVDARSDLFSAGLVLVNLLTGWRRRAADQLAPPPGTITDPALAAVLARALATDPAARFQSAADFAAALAGESVDSRPIAARPPFRHLAPLTERDHGSLYGRERDLAALTEHVLFRRAVIYTGPSGMGKTSLLRAGLVPRLEELGARAVYVVCRPAMAASLAPAIWPGSVTIAEAIAAWHQQRGRKLILILDQLEAVLTEDIVAEVLAFDRWPAAADVAVVLGIREDLLGRLVGAGRRLEEGISILRLGPLDETGARAAIVGPLAEHRLTIAPDLLEVLLRDLRAAAASLGAELGWEAEAAAYPPHLQLACSVLYEALGPGEAVITLEHYRRLGGLDAIVGEQLERVLDSELDVADAAVAKDLFLALVTAAHGRAFRAESELLELVAARHPRERVLAVLEALRTRGLLVRVRATAGEAGWELIHDSLVPRVLSWLDRQDLARRRAVELLRYHLRRSRAEAPSLLGRPELRELRGHEGAVAELNAEWAERGDAGGWTPAALVKRSRSVLRRQVLSIVAAFGMLGLVAGMAGVRALALRAERAREESLRDRDLGRFVLELRPFDWDEKALKAIPVPASELPELDWKLYAPDEEDPESPGKELPGYLLVRGSSTVGEARLDHVEARGGSVFLRVSGRNRAGEPPCPASLVHIAKLPGYAARSGPETPLHVIVPSCRFFRADMVQVPAGPFLFGGPGEPPVNFGPQYPRLGITFVLGLETFAIDRKEVSNAGFSVYAAMLATTGTAMPAYPDDELALRGGGDPVAGVSWFEAREYCRFMGKELPTSAQWQKAARGGILLADSSPNPMPMRNLPWGTELSPMRANIAIPGTQRVAMTGSYPGDVSPYGVLDLAGNVQEWTDSLPTNGAHLKDFRVVRGGDYSFSTPATLAEDMALENRRQPSFRAFMLGMRCAQSWASESP